MKDKLGDDFQIGCLVAYPYRGKGESGKHLCIMKLGQVVGIRPDRLILQNERGRRVPVKKLSECVICRPPVDDRLGTSNLDALRRAQLN